MLAVSASPSISTSAATIVGPPCANRSAATQPKPESPLVRDAVLLFDAVDLRPEALDLGLVEIRFQSCGFE